MAKIFYDKDADLSLIRAKKVAIIGYGSQGHAHALNLRDSGVDVRVGLAPTSKSVAKAKAAGLKVVARSPRRPPGPTSSCCSCPTRRRRSSTRATIAPHLAPGKTLMFAHGFNIRFGTITPRADIDVTMIAPKGPGHRVRETYEAGGGVPALIAVHQDATRQGARAGARRTRRPSARRAPACSRRRSRRRPRRTSSASRRCSAAA